MRYSGFLRWPRRPRRSTLTYVRNQKNSGGGSDALDQLPPGGGRTLRDLIVHCASVKRMHVNHAFGEGTLTWWTTWNGEGPMEEANLEALTWWLREGHAEAQEAVAELSSEL